MVVKSKGTSPKSPKHSGLGIILMCPDLSGHNKGLMFYLCWLFIIIIVFLLLSFYHFHLPQQNLDNKCKSVGVTCNIPPASAV